MNFKLIFKAILILAVLALLVVMGMNNSEMVTLRMPPIMPQPLRLPGSYMYFGFFGVGFVVGALMLTGSGGSRKSSAKTSDKK